MEFEGFTRFLKDQMEFPEAATLTQATGLYDDLELDSLQAFELIIVIESIAGLDVPPVEMPELFTIGQAFDYYEAAVRMARQPT